MRVFTALARLTDLCVYRFDQIETHPKRIEAKIDRPLLDPVTVNIARPALDFAGR
jgi:hypothetical protein